MMKVGPESPVKGGKFDFKVSLLMINSLLIACHNLQLSKFVYASTVTLE